MEWTEEEKAKLKQLYARLTLRQAADTLQRPVKGVKRMVVKLGLSKRAPAAPWTPKELQALRALFPAVGAAEAAQAVGRSPSAVKGMAYRLGLSQQGRSRHLPLGTERLVGGRIMRKVSMDKGFLENWRPVTTLEKSPELRELYRLLAQIQQEARAQAKWAAQ